MFYGKPIGTFNFGVKGGDASTLEMIDIKINHFLYYNQEIIVAFWIILLLLLALNLIYRFRNYHIQAIKSLSVMSIAACAAFFLSYAFTFHGGTTERPIMLAIGTFLSIGAYFVYRELFEKQN